MVCRWMGLFFFFAFFQIILFFYLFEPSHPEKTTARRPAALLRNVTPLTQRGNARNGGGVAVATAANSAAVVDISVCYANHFLFLQNRLICCTSKMLHWPVTTPNPSTSFMWLTRGTLTMVLHPPSRRGMGRRTPSVSSRFGRELPHLC